MYGAIAFPAVVHSSDRGGAHKQVDKNYEDNYSTCYKETRSFRRRPSVSYCVASESLSQPELVQRSFGGAAHIQVAHR